jgi:anti-sigma-K factor RskA
MRKGIHYLLTFGDWVGASFWRSAVFLSAVALIILVAD